MRRHCFALDLKNDPGLMEAYRKWHEPGGPPAAEHLAKDDQPDGADQFRMLAGLIHQLAEQVERMVATVRPPIPGAEGYPEEGSESPLRDRAR